MALIVYHSLLIAHTPTVHSTFTDNCITLITWYRMARMPCTRLHKVGVSMRQNFSQSQNADDDHLCCKKGRFDVDYISPLNSLLVEDKHAIVLMQRASIYH